MRYAVKVGVPCRSSCSFHTHIRTRRCDASCYLIWQSRRNEIITEWHDRQIGAGEDWKSSIDERLERADIILLLVSADFLESDYCFDIEMKRALQRHDAGEARVIPIIVRACDWTSSPFGRLQALPRDGKPVSSWESPDEAWASVASEIRGAVGWRPPITARSGTSSTDSSYSPTSPRSTTSLEIGAHTRVQQDLLRARMADYGFDESTLEETLDPANAARVNLLLAHLEESLRTEGFVQSTVDKTITIASELLTNVKRHAAGSAAHFAMRCRTVPLRYVNLCVADDRGGFDLDTIIAQLRLRMTEGEREHGLLRVHRMSSLIRVSQDEGYSAVLVDIYEKDRPPSEFFNIPDVASILLEYENPRNSQWLGPICSGLATMRRLAGWVA
jgi:anti-sigma regulatory factor (Ser/Thr protein kinase)